MRLSAFLAKAGLSSRRKAAKYIKQNRIRVNGAIGQLNSEVGAGDIVELDGKEIKLQQNRYILLNKPAGYVSTLTDPRGRPKILDLLRISERIVPVGRLDKDTTGAILLTNDGELAHRLMHPSFEIDKIYEAQVEGEITGDKLSKLERGIKLEDGPTRPAKASRLSDDKIELTIHEGRKHQVKRMLAAVELPVRRLHRSKYGPLDLTGLKLGEWRELTDGEIARLKG